MMKAVVIAILEQACIATFAVAGIFFLQSCRKDEKPVRPLPPVVEYSFFVAGHTYGKPGANNTGLHPPMVAKFGLIKSDSTLEFGVLTGDIVEIASESKWDAVDSQLHGLDMPVYFVAGNHDIWDRPLYESRYGSTFYWVAHHNDLFIVLDPNYENWNISAEQLAFLQNVLYEKAGSVNNIFVFFHQLLWWEPDNIYKNVQANSLAGRADSINFWTEVEPRLNVLPNPVFLFCGDVGAHPTGDEFMYHHYDNVTLIASGMGGEQRDNFVICDTWSDKSVTFRLISLNTPGIYDLGRLEDYVLE
jgi:hypothetical protein